MIRKLSSQEGFDPELLTSSQLRAARALLGISAQQLAALAKVGVATLSRAESGTGLASVSFPIRLALVRALEHAGVEFIAANGAGEGVRLARRI